LTLIFRTSWCGKLARKLAPAEHHARNIPVASPFATRYCVPALHSMADSVLSQLESKLRDYEDRIAQYEREREVYEARITQYEREQRVYERQVDARKKRRASSHPTDGSCKKKQIKRWVAAGQRIIDDIGTATSDLEQLQIQDTGILELDGTLFVRGTNLAKRAASFVHNSNHAARIARIALFFCLSTIHVLEKQKAFVNDEHHELMDTLDNKTRDRAHQKRNLRGAAWLHTEVISVLWGKGWKLGCAIAAVALSRLILPQGRQEAHRICRLSYFIISI
jgi:hypothetical protein